MTREDTWRVRDDRSLGLSSAAKLVWYTLESRGDDCRPSIATTAADCSLSRSTVKRAIAELAAAGCLKIGTSKTELGDPDTNSYIPVFPVPPWVGPHRPHPPTSSAQDAGGSVHGGPTPGQDEPGVGPHRTEGRSTVNPKEEKGSVKEPTDSLRSSVGGVAKQGSRIPEDFIEQLRADPEQIAWFRAECPDVDGRVENQKFMNYWLAKTGKDATKRDWVRTWRNWMLKAQQDAARFGHRPADRNERNDAALAAYLAKQDDQEDPAPGRPSLRVITGELDSSSDRRAIEP